MPETLRVRPDADNVRRRIAYERRRLGWSREHLSRALALTGCDISSQDLARMEKPSADRRPRRVRVEELPAFAEVFQLPLQELYNPPEVALTNEATEALAHAEDRQQALVSAYREFDASVRALVPLMGASSRVTAVLNASSSLEDLLIKIVNLGYDLEADLRREVGTTLD